MGVPSAARSERTVHALTRLLVRMWLVGSIEVTADLVQQCRCPDAMQVVAELVAGES